MSALQSCTYPVAEVGVVGEDSSKSEPVVKSGGIERALKQTRNRILRVLDRELDQIRATYTKESVHNVDVSTISEDELGAAGSELLSSAPLPQNVVSLSRDFFATEAPREALLDPDLEKATVEELNAALAEAFNHVAMHHEEAVFSSGE